MTKEMNSDYLRQARTIIHHRLVQGDVTRTQLADAMGMHRSTLHRHLNDLGGMPVRQFLACLTHLNLDPFTLQPTH